MYDFKNLKNTSLLYVKTAPWWAWAIAAVVFLSIFLSLSGGIGQWWEDRKQKEFDKKEQSYVKQIKALQEEKEAYKLKASAAEQKEAIYALQVAEVRKEIEISGTKLKALERKLGDIEKTYAADVKKIEDFKNGKLSAFEFCVYQCQKSAELGYPCRANYCLEFFKEER